MLTNFLFSGASISGPVANLGLLIGRIFLGLFMAFSHGMGKLPPADGFIGAIGSMGFPIPAFFAWSAALSEFLGALFVSLGLMTRFSSLMLMCTMAVAVFIRHGSDPFAKKELGLVYFFSFLIIFALGAGRYSIDAMVRKKMNE